MSASSPSLISNLPLRQLRGIISLFTLRRHRGRLGPTLPSSLPSPALDAVLPYTSSERLSKLPEVPSAGGVQLGIRGQSRGFPGCHCSATPAPPISSLQKHFSFPFQGKCGTSVIDSHFTLGRLALPNPPPHLMPQSPLPSATDPGQEFPLAPSES